MPLTIKSNFNKRYDMLDPLVVEVYVNIIEQLLIVIVLFYLALLLRKVNYVFGSVRDSVEAIENTAEEVEKEMALLEYLPFTHKGDSDGE